MKNRSYTCRKTGVVIFLFGLLLQAGCDNRADLPAPSLPGTENIVPVALTVDFSPAQEPDASLPSGGRPAASEVSKAGIGQHHAGAAAAFDYRLLPVVATRAGDDNPQSLYNLEIRQYNTATGTCLNPGQPVIAEQAAGASFTADLAVSDACTLVLVAWGKTVADRLGTGTLAAAREVTVDANELSGLDPAVAADRDKMPYFLYLPEVKVSADGKIGSPRGQDIRLLLQRLAVRVGFHWTYQVSDYALKAIRLESVPKDYRVIPSPDKAGTYPSLLDQYTTLTVPEEDMTAPSGQYAFWIPACVRGTVAAATSAVYRTKALAPTGSVYATFIAQHRVDEKQKLNYRLYLGGNTSSDFNLYANKDYLYTVGFTHTGLPVNDRRVTIIDPIPASENNSNFVPTANCFMVAPGGAFCFNPYTFYVDGADSPNTLLQSWCASAKIKSVKVYWQTKENGDVGDAVLGTVNSSSDHTNIVELTEGDDFAAARIYCRVAPNTTGGSGLIAAYDGENGTGNILWSWHIWVTDYNPEATGNATVLAPASKRKQKYEGNGAPDQLPMMDRNVGAMAGYDALPPTPLEQSKANGFHYQGGRKDPFPSSYSAEAKSQINDIYSATPPKGMLNLYGPDGLTYKPRERSAMSSIQQAYRNPMRMYTSSNLSTSQGSAWSGSAKTVHDPCPAGWRVAAKEHYRALFSGTYLNSGGNVTKYTPRLAAGFGWDEGATYGGYLVVYDNQAHATYFRMTGFGNNTNSFVIVGQAGNVWTRDYSYTFDFGFNVNATGRPAYEVSKGWLPSDAHTARCIQERE